MYSLYFLQLLWLIMAPYIASIFLDICVKWMNKSNAKYFAISKKCWFVARYRDLRPDIVSRLSLGYQICSWIFSIAYLVLFLIALNEAPYDEASGRYIYGTLDQILTVAFYVLGGIYTLTALISIAIACSLSPHDIDRMSKF